MTKGAFEELIALIMLDDYVMRRKALDVWAKRWACMLQAQESVASADRFKFPAGPEAWLDFAKERILDRLGEGLATGADEAKAVRWKHAADLVAFTVIGEVHIMRQEPLENFQYEVTTIA